MHPITALVHLVVAGALLERGGLMLRTCCGDVCCDPVEAHAYRLIGIANKLCDLTEEDA